MVSSMLRTFVSGFPKSKILCLGDVMLDQFVYGNVDRISPEAPVPIFHVQRRIEMLGGAGNVVRNISSLKGNVHFIGVVGSDDVGHKIEQKLTALQGVTFSLVSDPHRCSTHKTRYVSGSHQLLRVDEEAVNPLTEELQSHVISAYQEALLNVDVVLLSDYGKGFFTRRLVSKLIQMAQDKNLPVIVDPKGKDYSVYKGATVLTPNLKELEAATSLSLSSEEMVKQASHQLQELYQITSVLVTRSRDGMTLIERDKDPLHIPAVAQEVYDVSGAGDTVIATFALALAGQHSLEVAARIANQAAGLVVRKVGTATVTPAELQEALGNPEKPFSIASVHSKEKALEQVLAWHRQGLRVGFTNGCFDILHTGHISLLDQARARCDRLIIGLNSDASVRCLKGEKRPINQENCRAKLLISLSSVDLVVIFEEETPLSLIRYLKPDLLVKGAEYSLENVVGASDVASWGGEVFLAELVQGKSTTNIIKDAA
jgi:D-beta-D-heptose 7-phosphate kinase/D-beta-D-heptose 1-phosphate adenosyltransferase